MGGRQPPSVFSETSSSGRFERDDGNRYIPLEISQAAFEAVPYAVSLSSVGYEAKISRPGHRQIWLRQVTFNHIRALRNKHESYSDLILRLAYGEVSEGHSAARTNEAPSLPERRSSSMA